MTFVEQDVVDRVDIEIALGKLARCALTRDVAILDTLLTDDAVIDTTAIGGAEVARDAATAWLTQTLAPFSLVVPVVGDVLVSPGTGAAVDVESTWHAVVVPTDDGVPRIAYGVARDQFVRSDDGWRIARRTVEIGIVVEMMAPPG